MNTYLLLPCPGCGYVRRADEGHHLCRACEGYQPDPVRALAEVVVEPNEPEG